MTIDVGGASWHGQYRGLSIMIAAFVSLFIFTAFIMAILRERPNVGKWFPKNAMIILVGIGVGSIVNIFVASEGQGEEESSVNAVGNNAETSLSVTSSTLFALFLTPIVFNSGYHLNRQYCTIQIVPIRFLSGLGTAISMAIIATILYYSAPVTLKTTFLECMSFGAVLSATNPSTILPILAHRRVQPSLYQLISAEALFNNGVALVLFDAMVHLMEKSSDNGYNLQAKEQLLQVLVDLVLGFFGSYFLGMLIALGAALFFKHVDLRNSPSLEVAVFSILLYLPFALGEIARCHGIVTALFCGMGVRYFCAPNLAPTSAANAAFVFRLMALVGENFILLDMGITLVGLLDTGLDIGFIVFALLASMVGRGLGVYPVSFFSNVWLEIKGDLSIDALSRAAELADDPCGASDVREKEKVDSEIFDNDRIITVNMAHMLWFAGLRGVMSYSMVKTFPDIGTGNKPYFVVATVLIVLCTNFFFGCGVDRALKVYEIPISSEARDLEYTSREGTRDFTAEKEAAMMKSRIQSGNFVPPGPKPGTFVAASPAPTEIGYVAPGSAPTTSTTAPTAADVEMATRNYDVLGPSRRAFLQNVANQLENDQPDGRIRSFVIRDNRTEAFDGYYAEQSDPDRMRVDSMRYGQARGSVYDVGQ